MNACRSTILVPVVLMLLVGAVAAQVPEPAIPAEEPPVPAALPPVPPGIPGVGIPGVPPAIPDPGAPVPGMPPELPNLQVPPPAGMEDPGMPPALPRGRQSSNPLLKLFDTNGDGVLSGDEVEAAPSRLWELDRNFDAELSAVELGLVLAPRWQERRRGVQGHLPVESAPIQPAPPEPNMPILPQTAPGAERARFEVYPLRGLDPGQTLATLQQLLKDQPQARLTYDGRTRSILALAPPSTHIQIREALADLLDGERRGIPGMAPGINIPNAPDTALPVMSRPVPLYNSRARDVLRVVKQVYRDKLHEPRNQPPAGDPRFPGGALPVMDQPVVPAGKMVIGEGAAPNTIVISAEDSLFFEVLDLIERLDESQVPAEDEMVVPPGS
jgi:type II/III secretion system protein